MNLSLLYWGAGILVVINVMIFGYFLYRRYKAREEPENQAIFEHFMPQYSQGYTDGIIDEIKFGEKRTMITFWPRDINYIKELKKDKMEIKPITMFFDKKQVISLPYVSGHRFKIKAFPDDPDLLPEDIKQTKYGHLLMRMITENNLLTDESKLLKIRLHNLQVVAKQTIGGQIFTDYMDKIRLQMKDLAENVRKDEKKVWEAQKT